MKEITDKHKEIASHFGMAWNPLGNIGVFTSIKQNILNYFQGKKHNLDDFEIKLVEERLKK